MEQTANAIKLNVNSIKHQFLTLNLPYPSANKHPELLWSPHTRALLAAPALQQVNSAFAVVGGDQSSPFCNPRHLGRAK